MRSRKLNKTMAKSLTTDTNYCNFKQVIFFIKSGLLKVYFSLWEFYLLLSLVDYLA